MQRVTFTNSRGQSIELSNRAPFLLSKIEGLGDVDADTQMQKAPFQDGATYTDSVLQERPITLEIGIIGDNPQDVQAKRSFFASVFNPKLGEGLLIYENDSGIREIKAVADGVPAFPSGSENRGNTFQRSLINLICPDPYWKSPQVTEEPMAAFVPLFEFPFDDEFEVGSQGDKRTFINDGDSPTPVLIRFRGPAVNPEIRNNTTGEIIRVNRTLGPGDELVINTAEGEKSVEINGEDVFSWIDLDSDFWKLAIGENEIEYRADSGQAEATLTIEWQEKFVAV